MMKILTFSPLAVKDILLALLLLCAPVSFAQTKVYFVDYSQGADLNTGDIYAPFKTIGKALTSLGSDIGTIYLRQGTYLQTSKISLTRAGQTGNLIKLWAYQNEEPTVDFTGNTSDGFSISGSYYHLKGIRIKKAGHNGINISGNNNIIENCTTFENGNTGLHLTGATDPGPSNNLVLNCDSYRNADLPDGGNADGFSAKWTVGPGNVFRGCRAYNNSDDGWDLWMCTGSVTIDSCYAFRNGIDIWGTGIPGANGNGIKLGGNYVATPHTVKNCVSFDNAGNTGRGFDENNNMAGQTLYNCTAFRNKQDNFHFANDPLTTGKHVIKNCISYLGGKADIIKNATMENNSWQGFTITNADFQSLDTSGILVQRDPGGKLPRRNFLRLAQTSIMINAGSDVGIPFKGSAPDLGAFEYESLTGLGMPVKTSHVILGQNFPNPFSQTTNIPFTVDRPESISLKIFNNQNSLVASLVDNSMAAGNYTCHLDARNFSAGTYFCVLTSGDQIQTRKLILIK
jgi:hypothetical protein